MATIQDAPKALLAFIFLLLVVLTTSTSADDCPTAETDIEPCYCTARKTGMKVIKCPSVALNDSQMSKILKLLNTKGLDIEAENNVLTKFPAGYDLKKFTEYVSIYLEHNKIESIRPSVFTFGKVKKRVVIDLSHNLITSIPAGAFKFPLATTIVIYLKGNPISSISPGFFEAPKVSKEVFLDLSNTKLTRLEENVFKPVLQSFADSALGASDSLLTLFNTPIDCTADKCHLAWLIRDNRELLEYLHGATCSDGTDFKDLDHNSFAC